MYHIEPVYILLVPILVVIAYIFDIHLVARLGGVEFSVLFADMDYTETLEDYLFSIFGIYK